MDRDPHKKSTDNVIDLAAQRQRQRTLQKKKQAEKDKKKRNATWGGHDLNLPGGRLTWKHYLQFFLFLAILAYMLEQCRH